MDLIADTTFLVGLWRCQSWALDFAKGNPGIILGIPWVVRGEFRHGAVRAGHDAAEVGRFLSLGLPLDDADAAIPFYASVAAGLQEGHPDIYQAIGQNDPWVAAVALQTGLPLLMRNRRHFGRIEGFSLNLLDS